MKNLQVKKLFAFIVSAFMFSSEANAQIVYTDVNPDFSNNCTPVSPARSCNKVDSIDINNDGIFDLKLSVNASTSPQLVPMLSGTVRVSPLHGSAIKTDASGFPLSMNLNDVIHTNGSWITTADRILISRRTAGIGPSVAGNWPGGTDKYLGLKIISGNQTNYCWVRLNLAIDLTNSALATFTLKDFAFNSTPDSPILAGQEIITSTMENLSLSSSIVLYPDPAKNQFTIDMGSKNPKVDVSISDLKGTVLYSTTANGMQKIGLNTSDYAAGMYLVKIQTGDFVGTKRLIVSK